MLAATIGVLGCSDSSPSTTNADAKCIDDAKEITGSDDVEVDDGVAIIEGPGGRITCGDRLPDDFPEDDLPLPDGEIVGTQITGELTSVRMELSGEPAAQTDAYRDELEAAGYEPVFRETEGFEDFSMIGDLLVTVTAVENDGQSLLVVSYS